MNLEIIISLSLALAGSLIVIGLLMWYVRKLLSRLLFVSENISDLVDMIESYSGHLTNVHGLDQYYGDETIKLLIAHTNSLLEMLEGYEDIYTLSVPIEENAQIEQEIEQEDEEQAKAQQQKERYDEENVFYAGTRTGNN